MTTAVSVQHRLFLSLLPPFVYLLCVVPSSLSLFCSFHSSFYFPCLHVHGFEPHILFTLNSNVLTSRPTPQHVGRVIFKSSIYAAFISVLFYSAESLPLSLRAAGSAGDHQLLLLKRMMWRRLRTGRHARISHPSPIFHS